MLNKWFSINLRYSLIIIWCWWLVVDRRESGKIFKKYAGFIVPPPYEELELPLEFWQLFELFLLKFRSSLNTKFRAIIVKAKLIELLMLCYVFSPKEPVSFKPLCNEKTRGLYSQYLHIAGRTPATTQSLSSFDQLTLEKFIDGFHDGISTERAPVTIWPSLLSVYTMSRCRMHLEVFIPTDSIVGVRDLVYTSKFCSSCASA